VYKRKAIAGLCGYAGRMWQPSKPRPPQPLRGVSVRTTRCAPAPRDTTSRSGVCGSAWPTPLNTKHTHHLGPLDQGTDILQTAGSGHSGKVENVVSSIQPLP
jgi:hypothetical protein